MIKVNSDGEPNEVIVLGADSSALLAALKAEQYAAEALASKKAAAASEANAAGSEAAADTSAKAAATSEKNSLENANAAAGSEAAADASAKAAATAEKNSLENAKAAAGSKAAADASAQAAAGSAATAQAGANTATEQANLAKQYKEDMFNGTPEGFANLIDKVDALAEESIGSFRAINGKIHIKTA